MTFTSFSILKIYYFDIKEDSKLMDNLKISKGGNFFTFVSLSRNIQNNFTTDSVLDKFTSDSHSDQTPEF